MAFLDLYKVDIDTPQPNGRRGESPRVAFIKYNNLIDRLEKSLVSVTTILGSHSSVEDLPELGNTIGDAWIVGTHLYVWTSDELWQDLGEFKGPQGDPGEQGLAGASVSSASFVGSDIVFTLSDSSTVTLVDAINTLKGDQGDEGKSIYQVWLDEGNSGTEGDFLLSIKGDQGEQGIQGEIGPQGPIGLKGDTGYSAYEAAVNTGFVGSEAEWVASLVGPQGNSGWSPEIALVSRNDDVVMQIVDWSGGEGSKPSALGYIGESGVVVDIEDAINIRGATGEAATITVGTTTQGETASVTNSGTSADAIFDFVIPKGDAGWTPKIAAVFRNDDVVMEITDWEGGEGTKPTALGFIGETGIVSDINDATNIRGIAGAGNGNVNTAGAVSTNHVALFSDETGLLIKSGGQLHDVAFSGDYSDLTGAPPLATTTTAGIVRKATLTQARTGSSNVFPDAAGVKHHVDSRIMTSVIDTTAGRLLRVGSFGIGDVNPKATLAFHANDMPPGHRRSWEGSFTEADAVAVGLPELGGDPTTRRSWHVETMGTATRVVQYATEDAGNGTTKGRTFIRVKSGQSIWHPWEEVFTTGNSQNLTTYRDKNDLKDLGINGTLLEGGGFPRSMTDELNDNYSGNNPDLSLVSQSPVDLAQCSFVPSNEISSNFVHSNFPWMSIGGAMKRLMPVDIRTNLFNSPVSFPLFKPTRTNGSGILSFRYIGDKPIHTVIQGNLNMLIRSSVTSVKAYSRVILRLESLGHPHLEQGENNGVRSLGVSLGGFREPFYIDDYEEYNDLCFPIDQGALDNVASQPNLYVGSDNGFFSSNYASDTEELALGDGNGPVGPEVRTTKWMDVESYVQNRRRFLMNFTGTSTVSRVQYKDAAGNIKMYTQMNTSGSSRRIYRLPSDAKFARIYYSGRGDTVDENSIEFKPIGATTSAEYDPLAGRWIERIIPVHRDIVLWPGVEYWFNLYTQAYDGASARSWGFRVQSGGLSFLFDSGGIRKNIASTFWEK